MSKPDRFMRALRRVIAPLSASEQREILEWAADCQPAEDDMPEDFVRTIIGEWLYSRLQNMDNGEITVLLKIIAALHLVSQQEQTRFNRLLRNVQLPGDPTQN